MNDSNWIKKWDKTLHAVSQLGGEIEPCVIQDKATKEELLRVEQVLGYPIPMSFKTVLETFSSEVSMRWFFHSDYELDGDLSGIFSGVCYWSLHELLKINEEKNEWVRMCFSDEKDTYNRVWHNKLAFQEVGNGDFIAIDLTADAYESVVYLSHDGDTSNGMVLGHDFTDYVTRISEIGCCGPEDWQLMPFIPNPNGGICLDGKNACRIKQLFNL